MTHEIICAGFGGQGVLLIGRLVTYAGMLADKQVSWMPAYGPEMRGGTASCSVIISDAEVASPVVSQPTVLVAMNQPSLEKFEPTVQAGGVVIINKSLIEVSASRDDVTAYCVPLNELALEVGNTRYANMVALGALIGATDMVPLEEVRKTLAKNFAKKPEVVEPNMQAVMRGVQFVHDSKNSK
ncbi:2-oxoacid:acceptor oxidoreductase family protein [Sporomusa sphaeroides]|uniref:2-oxoacid:acceptor oxidoreductase family protein n=1 Tax=Sporomusa sphaeroides TaxID=47679 RepID=UPI003DA164E9